MTICLVLDYKAGEIDSEIYIVFAVVSIAAGTATFTITPFPDPVCDVVNWRAVAHTLTTLTLIVLDSLAVTI